MLMEANLNAKKQMEQEQATAKTEPKQEPRKKLNGANEAVLKVARSITENYKGFNLNKLSGQIAAAYRMAVDGDADSAMAEVRKIAADIAHTAKMEKESVNQEQYGALKSALEDFRHAYVEEADRADSAYKTGSIRAFNNAMRKAGINFSLVTNENIDAPKLEDVYRQMTEQGMYGDVHQFGDMLPRDINVKDMAQTLLDAAQRMKPDHTLVPAYEALGTTEEELADSIADDLAQGFADVQFSKRNHRIAENKKSKELKKPTLTRGQENPEGLTAAKFDRSAVSKILGLNQIVSSSVPQVNHVLSVLADVSQKVASKRIKAHAIIGELVRSKAVKKMNQKTESSYAQFDALNRTVRFSDHHANSDNFETDNNISVILANGGKIGGVFHEDSPVDATEIVFRKRYIDDHPEVMLKLLHDVALFIDTGEYHDTAGALYELHSGSNEYKAAMEDRMKKDKENIQNSVRDADYLTLAEKKRHTATDEKQMRKSVEDAAEEAMKNSKVRGEDGELLVVYHGTEEDFTVFDIGKGRANMDIQGAFFSPYMDDAEGYGGKVGAYYLNITNPADGKTAREVFQKYRKENNAGIKARQELEAMGYDGVINEDEYIAFHPEQIKSADLVTRDDNGNIIPLSQRFNQENPDIRYSVRSNEKNAFNPKGLTLHDQLQDSFDSAESFDRRYIYVGEFEGWFLKALRKYVKVEGLPIVMNYRDAYLAMHTKETGKYHGDGINYHSLGVTGLQNALESIDRTNAVMISKKGPEKIEIALDTVDVKNNRCLSIIAINTTAQSSGTYLATHVVTSVYGRKNIDKYIKAAEDEGRAIKIEAPASVRSQVQYEGAMITGASDGRIPEASKDVKQYSSREGMKNESYRNDAVADGGTFVQEYTDNAPEVHVPETWVSEYTDNKPTVYHDETRVYFSDGDGTRAAMEQNVEKNMREVTEEIIEPFAELKREDWHGIIAQTRNANFLKQMPVERVLDAICGKNAELRQKMYELVEKPFNEAGGKFARSREAMFQKYTKAMDDLGIKTREQSAAIQRIGEHSYQHKCTVQAWETGSSQYHVRVVDPEQMDVKKQTVTDGQRTFAIEDGRIPIAFRVSDGEGNMVDVAFTLHTENGKQTITLHHNVHGDTELFTAGQEGVKEYDMTFRDVMASFQGYGKTIASKAAKYGMAKNSPHVMTDSAYAPYTLEMLHKDHPDDWQNIVEAEKVSRRMYDEYVDSINHMLETVYPMVYEKDEQTIEQLQAKVDEAREDSANQRELITRIKAAIEQGQATIAMMDNTTQEYADAQHSLAVVEQRLKDATKKLAKLTKKAELREAKLTEYQAMVASGDTLRNKRLQKRSDYYHHFQELTDNVVVNLRNILKTNTDIDPQLVNISDQTKPKSKWTEFLQQRVGGAYTEDAVNGMYKYIAGAEYILAYDPLISRFREIQKQYDKATREMKGSSESVLNSKNANNFMRWMNAWVNNIAGKTHDIDRVISNEMGDRRGLKFIQKLNGLGKSAKLLFNVRSALVQVSNMTNAAMYVDAVDWKNGWFNCLNAMKGKEMAEILAKSNFVSQRLAEVPVFEEATLKTKAMNFANWMLSAGDSFSTQMTWWAAYNQYERIGAEAADAKGYRHYEDAIDYADDITRRTHGGRGVGELPVTLQSRLVNLFAPFQVEVLNTFENLVQVIGKKDAMGIAKMQCSIFAFNMVTRCIFGDGVLGFDFIHALMSILKDVFFPEDKEEKLQDHLKYAGQQLLGELISGVPFAAQAATFLVPDETARENMFGDSDPTRYGTGTIGLSFIAEMVNVYNDLVNGKDVTWDLLDATVGNYMTGGSQIMRTAKGLYTWVSGYSTDKKGNVQFAIDQDATELVLMAIFGKWAVPEAREYLGSLDPIADAGYKRTAPNGKKPGMTSDNQNAGYKEFVKAGGNGKDFIKMVKQCSMAEGQKDANGKTISGSVKQAKLDIINGYGLSASLKNIVLQALNIKE